MTALASHLVKGHVPLSEWDILCLHETIIVLPSAMKKVKHRLVAKMNESTADSLGLSRAVLVNGERNILGFFARTRPSCFCSDKLVKKVDNLEKNARVYRGKCGSVFIPVYIFCPDVCECRHSSKGQVFSRWTQVSCSMSQR